MHRSIESIKNLEHKNCVVLEMPSDFDGEVLVEAVDAVDTRVSGDGYQPYSLGDIPLSKFSEESRALLDKGVFFHLHEDEITYSDGSNEVITNFCFQPDSPHPSTEQAQPDSDVDDFVERVRDAFRTY